MGKVGECKTRNSLVESVTGCECGCELCVTVWDLSLVCVSTRLTLLHGFVSMIMVIVRTMTIVDAVEPSVYFILLRQNHQHHHHSHINDNNHLAQSQHKRRCLLEKLETPPRIGKNKNAPLKT